MVFFWIDTQLIKRWSEAESFTIKVNFTTSTIRQHQLASNSGVFASLFVKSKVLSTGSVFASNSGVFASLFVKRKVLSTGSVFESNSGVFASVLVKSRVLSTGSVFVLKFFL